MTLAISLSITKIWGGRGKKKRGEMEIKKGREGKKEKTGLYFSTPLSKKEKGGGGMQV